jgi:two-component system chemotaxis sensor kinase CheA
MTDDSSFAAGFLDDYFAECDEHLAAIRQVLLQMDGAVGRDRVPAAVLEELFRRFHSIKGISGMVELREAELLAHHLESYLRLLRERTSPLTGEGFDALVGGIDVLEGTISAHRNHVPIPAIAPAIQRLSDVGVTDAPSPQPPPDAVRPLPSWRVTFTPSTELLARGINVDVVRGRLRDQGDILDASPRVTPTGIAFDFLMKADFEPATVAAWEPDGIVAVRVVDDPRAAADDAGPADLPVASSRLGLSHVVRVDLTRLDELMQMVGELVISRARLEEDLSRVEHHVPAVAWRSVQEDLQTIERHLRDLREGVTRVRLVPVGDIFRRMPFVVRDLTRDTGMRVRLEFRGEHTEIDKFLIERMMDPVLHLVRNAVSHAFESPDERRRAGKPEEGTLVLSAASVGDSVVLEVIDDGRGIDDVAVKARARAAGLPVTDGPLDAAALLELICTPGFSTREETDRASGRGVGMAVVKTTIEELNGRLSLETERGSGTRFIIELPLTLSITDALIAHVGNRTFAVPQGQVREVVEIDPADLRPVGLLEIAPLRGGSLPILRLSSLFGIEAHVRRALHVFVHGSGPDAVGIAVDRISGQREIVVRTTSDAFIDVPGIAGATDLGNGRVVLILNLSDLVRYGRARAAHVEDTASL